MASRDGRGTPGAGRAPDAARRLPLGRPAGPSPPSTGRLLWVRPRLAERPSLGTKYVCYPQVCRAEDGATGLVPGDQDHRARTPEPAPQIADRGAILSFQKSDIRDCAQHLKRNIYCARGITYIRQ